MQIQVTVDLADQTVDKILAFLYTSDDNGTRYTATGDGSKVTATMEGTKPLTHVEWAAIKALPHSLDFIEPPSQ